MSFETIGPYTLNRKDLLAASLVISFVIGSRSRRIKYSMLLIGCVGLAIGGVLLRDFILAGAGIGALSWTIFGALLRKPKKDTIYLSYDQEGLIADTDKVRVTYKWANLQPPKKVGSWLFIMVSDWSALVIAYRFTSPENMQSLIATIHSHKARNA